MRKHTDVNRIILIIVLFAVFFSALIGLITASIKTFFCLLPVFFFGLVFAFGLAIGAGEADRALEEMTDERYK